MLVNEMQSDQRITPLTSLRSTLILLQRHMSKFSTSYKESRFDLDAIDRYIEQHLSQKISVAQLAGSVFLGESQFHSLFKAQIGITPHQYVLGKRVDMAKSLIKRGNDLRSGGRLNRFSSQSTFSHTFFRTRRMYPNQETIC